MKRRSSEARFVHIKGRNIHKNILGVSEAVGTILLLAIAIVLVGTVAIWVQTIPELPEQKKVNLIVNTERSESNDLTIDIGHQGGDKLDVYETSIHINLIYPVFKNHVYHLSDSTNSSLLDGYWDIGDHWNYTLTNMPENAEISIKVIDTANKAVIFDEDLLFGEFDEYLPDLEITTENILLDYSGSFIRRNEPVTISAVVYNIGRANTSAIVRFFVDNSIITSEGLEYKSIVIPYKYSVSAKNYRTLNITWLPDKWGRHDINIKIYSPEYELNYANNFASKSVDIEISYNPPKGVDLGLRSYDINPNNKYPIHGNDLNISIILHNYGDLQVRPGETFNVSVTLGNSTQTKDFMNGIYARDSKEFFVLFREVGPGGTTEIEVYIDPAEMISEEYRGNNHAIKTIFIMPTILVVDDDNADHGNRNVASNLLKSFTGRGITYDYYHVEGDDDINPQYNTGLKKLTKYDIVVWVTGYETANTLTATNIQNLKLWLNDNQSTNRLWLIGQDILNATVTTPGIVIKTDFAYEYMGIEEYTWTGNKTPLILNGRPGDPITDGMILNTSKYPEGMDRGVNFLVRPAASEESIFSILTNKSVLGSNRSMTVRYQNLSAKFKVVFCSFEITSISSAFDLSNVSYHVLKWFNYTIFEGYDFGVVDQQFSTTNPRFMDTITITATIVNNGPTDEIVDVIFYKTDPNGIESALIKFPDIDVDNPQYTTISGNGGRAVVKKDWLAVSVGEHSFRVMVDPYNHFQEIIETNNDFSYFGLDVTQLQIQYNILVVDDDNSTNNGGIYPDTATPVLKSLNDLNYFYDNQTVENGGTGPPVDGPDIVTLKHYNAVIWLTGNDGGPTLTENDQQNLNDYLEGNYLEAQYLTSKVNLLLVGQNILDDLNGSGNNIVPGEGFVRNSLRISKYSTNNSMGDEIKGIRYNVISHGSKYPLIKNFTDRSDILESFNTEDHLFYQNALLRTYNSIYFEDDANNSRIAFLAWELSFINNTDLDGYPNENYLNEFIYLMLNRFDHPVNSAELKVSKIDINISNAHPNIGNSYIITADVFNYGSVDCSAIVRFFDGTTIIDTDTIFVSGAGKTTAEVIWVPRFAGSRNISVCVDLDDDVPEVFEVLNNNALPYNTWVYFFWDDMENGTDNWHHDSTILRINGEGKLDYLDEPVYSNVNNTWAKINGFELGTDTSHSAFSSYSVPEPFGALAFDNFRYEFFLPDDKTPGFYAVAIEGESNFTVYRANSNGDWVPIYQDIIIKKGEIKHYIDLPPYYLYRVDSTGPLLIVKTSQEGSNANVANFDDGSEIGKNFGALGKKCVVITMEPRTLVTIKSYGSIDDYNTAVGGGTDSFTNKENIVFGAEDPEGTYQVYFFGESTTPFWVQSNKDIMVFRLSGDNDELDTAISTRGESLGDVIYWPYVKDNHPPRIVVYNTGSGSATIKVTDLTASHHNPPTGSTAIVKTNWLLPAYTGDTHGWDAGGLGVTVPGDNQDTRIFKAEIIGGDMTGLKIVYGGVSGGGDDFDVTGADKSSDDTYDLFGYRDANNNWRVSTPLLIGGNGHEDLEQRCQTFTVGGKTDIVVDGNIPVAFLDNTLGTNVLSYFSVMDTVIHYETMGTVTNILLSGVTGATVNMVTKTIFLPKGKHDTMGTSLKVTATGTGTWYLGIDRFSFATEGSFAWQLKNLAKWDGVDYSMVTFLGAVKGAGCFKYFWNFTSEMGFLYIVDGMGNCWIHTILPFEGSISVVAAQPQYRRRGVVDVGSDNDDHDQNMDSTTTSPSMPRGNNTDTKYLLTYPFSLANTSSAKLTFYHKYNLFRGYNGGLLQVGTLVNSTWKYQYVIPNPLYSNNLYLNATEVDDFNNTMRYGWNGVSGNGLFTWEYGELDLTPWAGIENVRIKFVCYLYGGGGGGGWWIDDVEVRVSRSNSAPITNISSDQWALIEQQAHSGSFSWWNGNPITQHLSGGLDNCLYTRPIDLTDAKNVTLSAYFKFNINTAAGRPPDGFRVEISSDNGITWDAINFGARSAWGISGNDSDGDDDEPDDGKSYTGINSGNFWVEAGTLTRLNCDLTGWRSKVIQLRFRVITSSDSNPYFGSKHYESSTAGFGGFYVDDVIIYGTTLLV